MSHISSSNHILPISIGQPAPSSFIIRQQQETLQRLQEQNLKQQQQIESLKHKYPSSFQNTINLRQLSPANPSLLTANRSIAQQQSVNDQISNNSVSIRQSTPPQYRQSQSSAIPQSILETGHFATQHSSQNQTTQSNLNGLNNSLFPSSYPNQTPPVVTQPPFQISPHYQSLQHKTIYKVQRNIQSEFEQPSIIQQLPISDAPKNLSPHSMRIEQVYTQKSPITQNTIITYSPEKHTHISYHPIVHSQNSCSIIQGYSHDKPNIGLQHQHKTVYVPVDNIKKEYVDPIPFSIHVNRFGCQDRDQPLFPESSSKGIISNRRHLNHSSHDFRKHNVDINKEYDIDYKTYLRQNQNTLNKDEFQKNKERQIQNKIEELEIQNQKLQNEIKMKNIEIDTHKSANEGYEKKALKYENRIKELENIIETLKIEQEKILDVCEKKDLEIEEQNLQLAEKQKEVNECVQKVQNMQQKFNIIQDKLQLYEDTQEELQSQMQKNASMDQRNNFLNQEVKNMKQIILDLESQMKQLQGQLPPMPYKQIEQETLKMQQYIQNLEQRLLIVSHEKNEEVSHWRSVAEIDSARVFEQMENRIKFLATENERLNQIIVGRCMDMRQNW